MPQIIFCRLIGPIHDPSEADLVEIVANIHSGILLVWSDGSFYSHSGLGSHAWVFATVTGQVLMQGAGLPSQAIVVLSSGARGITALLFLLTVISNISEMVSDHVSLYCNNKRALENVFDPSPKRGIYPLLAVDYDLRS